MRTFVACLVLLVATDTALGATVTLGLMRYLQRDDRAAMTALSEEARDETNEYVRFALSDLHLMQGDFAAARDALEGLGSDLPPTVLGRTQVWLTWIDFHEGKYAVARQGLEDVIATLPGTDVGDEATFTLGWQLLLRGAYQEAAATFGLLATGRDDARHWLPLRDQALLLEGEAWMWAGRIDEARSRLVRVEDEYRSSTVVDDAARDLAWCDHLQNDDERAIARLRRIAKRYRALHYRQRQNPVDLPWDVLAERGPAMLEPTLKAAYRKRPRGQFPLQFLATVGDRFAAEDARTLLRRLRRIDVAETTGASRALRSSRHAAASPATDRTGDAPAERTDRSSAVSAQHGIGWVLLALGAFYASRRRARRTAKSPLLN